jgi:O-antigen/teichoic acid export membrane protein
MPPPPGPAPEDDATLELASAGLAALRGSALRSLSYVGTIALSLVSVPLLIRHLGIAGFGRYTTVIALVTIVNGLTDGGLATIAVREWVTSSGTERGGLLGSLLGIRVELSLTGVLAGVAFAAGAGYSRSMVLGTLAAGAAMILQAVANLLYAPLQAELRFGLISLFDLARQVITVALTVALVLAGASLLPFFLTGIPAGLLVLLLTWRHVRGRFPLRPQLLGRAWWSLVRDSLPYSAAIAVNTLYFRVTIIVMSLVASATQTGYFATSFRVIEVLIGVPAFAIGTAFPILSHSARENRERFSRTATRVVELAAFAGVGAVVAVVLLAPVAIQVLAGAAGTPAVAVLRLQSLALVATFIAMASAFPLLSLRCHREVLVSNLAALVANVVLTLVLVPVSGARGAAIAGVVAESCLALSQAAFLMRRVALEVDPLTLVATLAAGAIACLPLLLSGVPTVARTVVGLLAYFATLAVIRRLPDELLELLRHARSGVREHGASRPHL